MMAAGIEREMGKDIVFGAPKVKPNRDITFPGIPEISTRGGGVN